MTIPSVLRQDGGRRALVVAAIGSLAVAGLAQSVDAQGNGRRSRDELVSKLTGKPVRIDGATGQRRAITEQEAGDLIDQVTTLTSVTATEPALPLPAGGRVLRLSGHGAGHLLVSKPNEDGSFAVRCVTSPDEAVDFLSGDLDEDRPDR